jgi:hypothetical protein
MILVCKMEPYLHVSLGKEHELCTDSSLRVCARLSFDPDDGSMVEIGGQFQY